MRDQYKKLMLTSFKDAMDVVGDYNQWCDDNFSNGVPVPPQAVPQIALMLYQSRVASTMSEANAFEVPEFDDKMYE